MKVKITHKIEIKQTAVVELPDNVSVEELQEMMRDKANAAGYFTDVFSVNDYTPEDEEWDVATEPDTTEVHPWFDQEDFNEAVNEDKL